jgi:hypothetical protein
LFELIFRDGAKISEMFDRFAAEKTLAERQALDYAINNGRGSIWLQLTKRRTGS